MRQTPRLAEWQTSLLAGLVVEGPDPDVRLAELATGRWAGDVMRRCCTGQPPT